MIHGFRSFTWSSSLGTGAGRFDSRLARFLCSLRRTPAATLRIGVSREGASFALSRSPVGEQRHLLFWLCRDVDRFSALPDDVDLALGMGLERPGTAAVLLVFSIGVGVIFRFRIAKPFFPCP